jgi:ABC-type transport system substrate-binding protein
MGKLGWLRKTRENVYLACNEGDVLIIGKRKINGKNRGKAGLTRRDFIIGATAAGTMMGSLPLLGGCGVPFSGRAGGSRLSGVEATRAGGTLHVASYWPLSVDPFYLSEIAGIQIASCLFDTLVKYDYRTGELVAGAAESWEANEEGTVFTFRLAKDARFHDDKAVTAFDVKYSWERILKPDFSDEPSGNASYIAMIQGAKELMAGEANAASGIRVVDTLTLEVTLTFPFHEFFRVLTYPAFAPVPLTGVADDFLNFSVMPIGNGPFKMPSDGGWLNGTLRLERFDDHVVSPALLTAVEFKFYESDRKQGRESADDEQVWEIAARPTMIRPRATQLVARTTTGEQPVHLERFSRGAGGLESAEQAGSTWATAVWPVADEPSEDGPPLMTYEEKTYEDFKFGELDVAQVPAQDIEDARIRYGESADGYTPTPGNQILVGPEACTQFLQANFAHEPLTDVKVREALSYAINREALCEELYFNTCLPATGIVPPGVEGFRDGAWPAASYQVSRAKQALSDAGYPGGKGLAPLTLLVSDSEHDRKFSEMIVEDLTAVGFQTELLVATDAARFQDALENSAALFLSGWIIDFPLMEDFLTPLFASFGANNQLQYYHAEVDEGIIAARAIANDARRVKAFQAVEDLIAADLPVIPLFFTQHTLACSDRVNELYVAPDGLIDFSKVWLSF